MIDSTAFSPFSALLGGAQHEQFRAAFSCAEMLRSTRKMSKNQMLLASGAEYHLTTSSHRQCDCHQAKTGQQEPFDGEDYRAAKD